MSDDIVFRRASTDDHEAILDIVPDLYQGMDYIMNEYKSLMTSGKYSAYLAELDGKAIAFIMCSTQLEGRKLCLKAGRVRREFQGQGVYGRLLAFQLQDMKKTYPCLHLEEFATNDSNASFNKLLKSKEYKGFSSRAFLNYQVNAVPNFANVDVVNIRDIGVDGIRSLLQDQSRCHLIFPTRVYVIWEMYDPVLSEISYIAKMDPDVLAVVNVENEITAVSTMGSLRTMRGRLHILQFHFLKDTPVSMVTKMAARLCYHHLRKLSEISDQDILNLSADEPFRNALSAVGEQMGFTKIDQFANCLFAFNREV